MKICYKCKIEKDESEFGKAKPSKDGLRYSCKKCEKEYKKEYYQENKEAIKEYKKEYNQNNKESIKENKKKYRQNNKESIKEYKKEYNQNNKESIKEYHKEYRQNNKDSIKDYNKEYNKAYRQENKNSIKEYNKEYQRHRKLNDQQFKIRAIISSAIVNHLKKNGGSKSGASCLDYLPYTMKELEAHIEKQFLETNNEWMNWRNWTIYDPATYKEDDKTTWTWNLDHIVPHSFFKYKTMNCEAFRNCWELSNLRPYKAKDNIEDGNRRDITEIKINSDENLIK